MPRSGSNVMALQVIYSTLRQRASLVKNLVIHGIIGECFDQSGKRQSDLNCALPSKIC
jgi:hypothetical protein